MSDKPSNLPKMKLDEETFQRLLEAAYVIQEQNDARQASREEVDFTHAMGEIVDLQQTIHNQHLELQDTLNAIMQVASRIVPVDGVAIGAVEGDQLHYRAAMGTASGDADTRVRVEGALSRQALVSNQILHSDDTLRDERMNGQLSREKHCSSLIAVPARYDGRVAGVLELRFARPGAFQPHHVQTAQLIAGLVSEAIARSSEKEWKEALAVERATMIEALERIKPQLERLMAGEAANAKKEPHADRDAEQKSAARSRPRPPRPAKPRAPRPLQTDVAAQTATVPPASTVKISDESPAGVLAAEAPETAELETAEMQAISDPAVDSTLTPESAASQLDIATHAAPNDAQAAEPPLPAHEHAPVADSVILPQYRSSVKEETESQASESDEKDAVISPAGDAPANARPSVPETIATSAGETLLCRTCGHGFEGFEAFCGICGTPRSLEHTRSGDIQSKWASMWRMQQAANFKAGEQAQFTPAASPTTAAVESTHPEQSTKPKGKDETAVATAEPAAAAPASPWGSASSAKTWLESLKKGQPSRVWIPMFWLAQRANIYLALSALLLLIAWFSRGPVSPQVRSMAHSLRRQVPAETELSFFDKLLVNLGLAEAPPPPVYMGNPNVQVWVDLQTAMYYCPGAAEYGQTPKGKYTTQKDAQLDAYDPAFHKVCD